MTATRDSKSSGPAANGSTDPNRPLPYPRVVPAPIEPAEFEDATGPGRRRFLTWAIAAPTLVVGTSLLPGMANPQAAGAAIPAVPEQADLFDLGDLQDLAAMPTSNLITVTVGTDGVATFALPRAEVGQGITTSTAMLIAEELDLPLSKVKVTLADSRPELLFNQLTGGSNTTTSTYKAIRTAAAHARARLVEAAAKQWGVPASSLTTSSGVVKSRTGKSATYGSLTIAAAASRSTLLQSPLKPPSEFKIIGSRRIESTRAPRSPAASSSRST